MKYQVNDIISIWVGNFSEEDYGYWLGAITRCDQEYYRIEWLIMASPEGDTQVTDTYSAAKCDECDDLKLYHRGDL